MDAVGNSHRRMTIGVLQLLVVSVALMPYLTGCSIFSFRSPDKPLPQRELNTRMLTREFAENFSVRVEAAADNIAKQSEDPATRLDALRWKLSASKASQRAATQMAPMMALLDTWALSEQMRQFFGTGAGAKVFGGQQTIARDVADSLASDAQKLARGLTSDAEFASYQTFVERYAHDQPMTDLGFVRTSVVDRWVVETNQQISLVSTVGSVSQSMSDVSERMRMFSERAPTQAIWETQLVLGKSDLGRTDFVRTFDRANDSLERLSKLAEASPEEVRAGISELRTSMLAISNRFDASWMLMVRTLQEEREALAANVRTEREAAVVAFGEQRTAFAKDAAQIADQAIASGGTQVRSLVREMMLYGILFFLVISGLPFAAGYFVGRGRGSKDNAS